MAKKIQIELDEVFDPQPHIIQTLTNLRDERAAKPDAQRVISKHQHRFFSDCNQEFPSILAAACWMYVSNQCDAHIYDDMVARAAETYQVPLSDMRVIAEIWVCNYRMQLAAGAGFRISKDMRRK